MEKTDAPTVVHCVRSGLTVGSTVLLAGTEVEVPEPGSAAYDAHAPLWEALLAGEDAAERAQMRDHAAVFLRPGPLPAGFVAAEAEPRSVSFQPGAYPGITQSSTLYAR